MCIEELPAESSKPYESLGMQVYIYIEYWKQKTSSPKQCHRRKILISTVASCYAYESEKYTYQIDI